MKDDGSVRSKFLRTLVQGSVAIIIVGIIGSITNFLAAHSASDLLNPKPWLELLTTMTGALLVGVLTAITAAGQKVVEQLREKSGEVNEPSKSIQEESYAVVEPEESDETYAVIDPEEIESLNHVGEAVDGIVDTRD